VGKGKSKGKDKVYPRTGHEGPVGEQRYSSTLSLTSALDGGGWSTPRPGRFTPGKESRYPLYRRLGWPQGRSGRVRKISLPPGFDLRTVHPVASSYTD
jgi:rRNA maturation protein Nop10